MKELNISKNAILLNNDKTVGDDPRDFDHSCGDCSNFSRLHSCKMGVCDNQCFVYRSADCGDFVSMSCIYKSFFASGCLLFSLDCQNSSDWHVF